MSNPYCDFEQLLVNLFDEPVERVTKLFHTFWNEPEEEDEWGHISPQHNLVLQPIDLDFAYAYLGQPIPQVRVGWDPSQMLFWEPRSAPGKTAMMSNSTCGDSGSVSATSRHVPWECIHARLLDQDGEPGNWMFNYYRDYRRVARCLGVGQEEDGRWLFCVDGPIQAFENPGYYKRRRIRDRLNREIITEYLLRLGYDIAGDDFWTTNSQAWLLWDDWFGQRSAPGRDGVDIEGTRTGWRP